MELTAFLGDELLARGDHEAVARAISAAGTDGLIVIEDATGRTSDLMASGPELEAEAASADQPLAASRRGRPKLGVTAREVTLLPRHWDWLSAQPGGASAALRRLVDQARKETVDAEARRQTQEAVYRVATTLAGDRPGYEDAIRALFANDMLSFHRLIDAWPPDIAAYLRDLTSSLVGPS